MQLWDDTKPGLWLLTPAEFEKIPDGTELEDILGGKAVKGKDNIDNDTRGGHLAYGIRDIENKKNLFILLSL